MAIEKTYFTNNSYGERQTEIANWLTANATDYFSSVEDTDSGVVCNLINGGSINLMRGNSNLWVFGANGSQLIEFPSSSEDVDTVYNYAIKTDNGIYLNTPLYYSYSEYQYQYLGCFTMSKDIDGHIIMSVIMGDYNQHKLNYLICPEKNAAYDISHTTFSTLKTSFSPIVFDESYTENLFWTPFSQFPGIVIEDMQDANGQHYFYDGFCALKY